MKKKALLALLALLGVLTLTGCDGKTNGWDALPVDGSGNCYQIQAWTRVDHFWTTDTNYKALGVFCKESTPHD